MTVELGRPADDLRMARCPRITVCLSSWTLMPPKKRKSKEKKKSHRRGSSQIARLYLLLRLYKTITLNSSFPCTIVGLCRLLLWLHGRTRAKWMNLAGSLSLDIIQFWWTAWAIVWPTAELLPLCNLPLLYYTVVVLIYSSPLVVEVYTVVYGEKEEWYTVDIYSDLYLFRVRWKCRQPTRKKKANDL